MREKNAEKRGVECVGRVLGRSVLMPGVDAKYRTRCAADIELSNEGNNRSSCLDASRIG